MRANALIIFIKYPQAGLVKTRLAKSIGVDNASLLYRLFVEALLKRTENSNYQRIICYTPVDKKNEIARWLGDEVMRIPQQGDTLGERLSRAFAFCFAHGARRVVAIGSDSPLLEGKILQQAFRNLEKKDCVLGPALDGGYYLIGLSSFEQGIFKGIDWGTEMVFEQTRDRLKGLQKTLQVLEPSFDVDTYDDILLLKKGLQDALRINSLGLKQIFDILNTITEGNTIPGKRKG